ncbi:uncharacterized protein DNG_07153 [Cephalotrichum gorgonifer]|uniref:Uncharacterized protein n=1 Tax=Cephalotrichum gorgonifer TaxID=2041049 RepID=A0AAE8SX72_9PEZI|nr:uncharacterized protein DNG_07153 [Cephalotrichum gorgonifer]
MAQPGVAEGNGVAEPHNLEQPAPTPQQQPHPADQSVAAGGKRKRDDETGVENGAADGVGEADGDAAPTNRVAESATRPNEKTLIRTIYGLLKESDPTPSVLDKPIPSPEQAEPPPSKRAKSEDTMPTVATKVARDEYTSLDELFEDISVTIRARLAEISPSPSAEEAKALNGLRTKAIELIKRELSYPQAPYPTSHRTSQSTTLTVTPNVQNARQLYSSLPSNAAAARLAVSSAKQLPPGVSATTLTCRSEAVEEKTLGDVLPAPRNRTPLLPSPATTKAAQPKPISKENVIGFYHPELSDSSMRRPNGYSSSRLAVGHYLDYTRATPQSPVKAKQRERAQSLAGLKPSTSELEVVEMESLFRTAFSSFAPCKDDSGAVVPSTVAGRMWWQKKGQHDFQSQIRAEYGPEQSADEEQRNNVKEDEDAEPEEIDDGIIENIITSFDPAIVFPSLRRSAEGDVASEEDIDALLLEVDDLILTLASSQHLRNRTKSVTSANRLAVGEPDMLTNSQLPEPSETEVETYETLKALLVTILQRLPPYAIAKLNGDQLDELLVSTRLPVKLNEYKGSMGEDEAAINERARQKMLQQQQQQQQQRMQQVGPSPANRTPAHRSSNASNYHTPNAHFVPPAQSRTPVPHPQYYRPPSSQAVPPNSVPRPGPPHISPTQHHVQPQRPPSQQYRTNGYTAPFAPQLAKTQTPYGHQGMAQYTPGARPQQTPAAYANAPPHASPNARYTNPYQAGYPQQQQVPAAHPQFGGYTNGAGSPSPQVGHPQLPYAPSPYQQQQQQMQQHQVPQQAPPRYGTPVNPQAAGHPRTPSVPNSHIPGPVSTAPGLTGYRTVMPESEQQRMMEQARVRAAAQERASSYTQQQPTIAGLAGIGLGVGQSANRAPTQAPGGPATPVQGGPPPQRGMMPNGAQSSQGLSYAPAKVSPVPVPVIPPHRPASQPNQAQYSNVQMQQPMHPQHQTGPTQPPPPQMAGQQPVAQPAQQQ